MGEVKRERKGGTINPLKSSAPLGAALAYLGIEGAVPLLHGAQGCTSFALVLAVRHFRESIPLQTTALNEVATILGGAENLEEALVVLKKRMNPKFVGIASTALVETRGEDVAGELGVILRRRAADLEGTAVAFASTPDFAGALEVGWSKATQAVIEAVVSGGARAPATGGPTVNILPGVHLTPGDIDELREIIEAFGLDPVFLPDTSGSLDGHVPDAYVGTTLGGTRLADVEAMGQAVHTIAIGEHMRAPAEALAARTGVASTVLPNVTGLEGTDDLVALLMSLSGRTACERLRRRRSQLVDAILDAHSLFTGKRVALAGDPDLLVALGTLVSTLGADVCAAVASTDGPRLTTLPCDVVIGDLWDLEEAARARRADLLVTHSHGRQAAERLGIPLYRAGFPIFDRLGAQHRRSVGYAGSRELVHDMANTLAGIAHEPSPEAFAGLGHHG
jgi:nitrogenase molybdenum-iron protein NifN